VRPLRNDPAPLPIPIPTIPSQIKHTQGGMFSLRKQSLDNVGTIKLNYEGEAYTVIIRIQKPAYFQPAAI
jgi:hypothetical protein